MKKLFIFWMVVAPLVFIASGHTVIESVLWGTASVLTGFLMFFVFLAHE